MDLQDLFAVQIWFDILCIAMITHYRKRDYMIIAFLT